MSTHLVTATDVSRFLSDILNKVYYQGESFDIKRGKEMIARIIPFKKYQKTMSLMDCRDFFKKLPQLDAEDALAFERDLQEIRVQAHTEEHLWDE